MRIIYKNFLHNSDVVLSKDFYNARNGIGNFYKSASTTRGITNVKNEVNGYEWYFENSQNDIDLKIIKENINYFCIEIPKIEGFVPNIFLKYTSNIRWIEILIHHYIYTWRSFSGMDVAPIHGDLSLAGNIIFKDSGPFIIDWEHFSLSGGPMGFDALYFLYEIMFFQRHKGVSYKTMDHIIKMIKLLDSNGCIAQYFKSAPLSNLISFIKHDQTIWGTQKDKIPILSFSKDFVDSTDDYFSVHF